MVHKQKYDGESEYHKHHLTNLFYTERIEDYVALIVALIIVILVLVFS